MGHCSCSKIKKLSKESSDFFIPEDKENLAISNQFIYKFYKFEEILG